MTPQIHFDRLEPSEWVGKTFVELWAKMEQLRIAVKGATNYWWDSANFYVDDTYGHPALQILFNTETIHLWNATNGCSIDIKLNDKTFDNKAKEQITYFILQIEKGLIQCNNCKQWVKEYKSYSYAGAVCTKCYDPKKHLPPDTRGD